MIKLNLTAPFGRWTGGAALALALLGGCGGGGGGGASTPPPPPPPASNTAPTASFVLSGAIEAGGAGADASAYAWAELALDAAGSKDAEGDPISFKWTIVSKPAASAAALDNDTAARQVLTPDAAGTWVLRVRVSDSRGLFTEKNATLLVRANARPLPAISLAVSYPGQSSTRPVQALSIGAAVVLDAAGSTDADGDAVSTAWTLLEKPAASGASLVGEGQSTRLVADVAGLFKVRARGTDARGAWSDTVYVFDAANRPPALENLVVKASFAGPSSSAASVAANVGDAIVLDGSTSVDADGDPVQVGWSMLEKPSNSTSEVNYAGAQVGRLVLDVAGVYKVRARGTDPHGAYSDRVYVVEAVNHAPSTVVIASSAPGSVPSGTSTLSTSTGYLVALNGSASSDTEAGAVSVTWKLLSKPAASGVTLSSASRSFAQFTPDLLGDYVVELSATDSAGAVSTFLTTVKAVNQRPLAAITSNTSPLARPSAPAIRLPAQTLMTLRGSGSVDADGDPLSYAWSITSKPAGSAAAPSATDSVNIQVNFDLSGTYVVRLRVADAQGGSSEQSVTVEVGNCAPVVVLLPAQLDAFTRDPVASSAALSFDEEGDALSFHWVLESRPAGSVAAIAAPNGAALAFTPDLAGTYVAAVTVSDGTSSSVGYVTIRVVAH
jgi:hypothetical protein